MSFNKTFINKERWLGVAAPLILAIMAGPPRTSAQALPVSVTRPEFDAASVRIDTSGMPSGTLSGTDRSRFSARNVTLKLLISMAWQVRDFQILGGPAWLNSDRFDIAATAGAEVEWDRMMLMLQKLLEDRFQLVTRRETRELPVYVLTAAKGGLKPHAGDCAVSSIPYGRLRIYTNGLDGQTSMPLFVNVLSDLVARPVIDETQFQGPFDVSTQVDAGRKHFRQPLRRFASRD